MGNLKSEAKQSKVKYWVISVLLLSLTVISGLALWKSNFSVENQFRMEFVDVSIEEEFHPPENWDGTKVIKKAEFKNEGTIPAVVRVQIVENFNLNGKILSTTYTDNNIVKDIVLKELSTNWKKIGNWYYYNKILNENATTGPFLESVEYDSSLPETIKNQIKGATYELSLVQEHVSVYDSSLKTIWNLADDFSFPSGVDDIIDWKVKP